MNCDELRELYELYALGVLEEEERKELDAHLARECPVCGPGVRRALVLNAVIGSFAPEAAPPRQLRDRVMASVGATRQQRGFAWWPVWALASAGLALAAFTFAYREQGVAGQLAEARTTINRQALDLEKSRQILSFLDQPETKQVGFDGKQSTLRPPRGNFFVNPKAGVLMIAQNLPRLEAGKTYQMWVIPKGQNPRPAGLFKADESGNAVHLQPGAVDVSTVGAMAISVEPESGSAQPTTTPIVVAPVGAL
jgi:anti-sigma-K factor RskA